MPRLLVLMGSGENSPAMVTPHQKILKAFGKDSVRLNLDTPYGFQENADELTERIRGYFNTNVGFEIKDVKARTKDANSVADEIRAADWVFSGPGSPTYALNVWRATGADKALADLLDRGALVIASAAAMSIGSKVMPVYEMYKVGEDPFWLEGLNLLEKAIGKKAAIIAHYNNTQGGNHDTRYCFAGERRFKVLESQLDSETGILGIDEHTGIAIDLDSQTAEVFGKGNVTYRLNGDEKVYPTKSMIQNLFE